MSEYGISPHGGDIYKASRQYGFRQEELLDYSANINPMGVPEGIKERIISSIDGLINYPDPDCSSLTEEIAHYVKVSEGSIIVGNGASEIIFLLFEVLAPKRVLIPAPAFSEYAAAAARYGAKVQYFMLKEEQEFRLNVDELMEEATVGIDAVVLCNPNNPTSTLVPKRDLKRLIEYLNHKGIKLIIDEAFIELTGNYLENTVADYIKEYDNLFIIRAFTKLLAIPGLRLGYGLGNPEFVQKLRERKLPWSVNSLAACVGEFLRDNNGYLQKTEEWIISEKAWFYSELAKIQGIRVFKPETNFVLIKLEQWGLTSGEIRERLARKGVLIRDASNFVSLDDRFIRVAIKDRQSNLKFLELFTEALRTPRS